MNDYFESEIFFKDIKNEINEIFFPRKYINKNNTKELDSIISAVSQKNSFCVHIRRGDTVNTDWQLPIQYQKKAMEVANDLINNPRFFIFSDDITQAKLELNDFSNLIYINRTPLEDFLIMSKCANNIIANSTFSWWAAYLNQNNNKIVIAPSPKFSDLFYKNVFSSDSQREAKHQLYEYDGYPKSWIQLSYK